MNLVKIVVAVCAVIFFACLMIPNKIEIKINHHHDFDFGGNLYKPICIQVGNQATVPLKVDVNHR
jgi:hypothetical protein